jgi:hypothetical protein
VDSRGSRARSSHASAVIGGPEKDGGARHDGMFHRCLEAKVVRQPVVDLEVRSIQIGVLKLESIIFVEELEVPLSTFSDTASSV